MENADEKIWQYLTEHKTLAKRFMFSQSHVNRILTALEREQKAEVVRVGSNKFYKVKV